MRARAQTGQYSGHNTPGDGTGFSKLPESDALTFMAKQTADAAGTVPARTLVERHTPVQGKE